MTPQAIQQLQTQLGVPVTGVFDAATFSAMQGAVASSLSKNKSVATYAGTNDPNAILNAYMTGDWSNVVSLSGKPFTDEQQKAAVDQATTALAPAYEAEKAYDTSNAVDTLTGEAGNLAATEKGDARQFSLDKNGLDQGSADNGVLFSGSRFQKLNDLRTSYANRDAALRTESGDRMRSTLKNFQYGYGNGAAAGLSSLYTTPDAPTYNANVAGGKVTSSPTLSSVYDPSQFNFQGTKPVAQTAAIQTRAAGLLANRANKLSLSGVGAKF
jgi:hypothetical protein